MLGAERERGQGGISQATVRNFMSLSEFTYYPDQFLGCYPVVKLVFLPGFSVHILFSPVTEYDIFNNYFSWCWDGVKLLCVETKYIPFRKSEMI